MKCKRQEPVDLDARHVDLVPCPCECCSRPVIPMRLEYPRAFPAWWIDDAARRMERFFAWDPDGWKDDYARKLLECRNKLNVSIIDRALARLYAGKP